MDTISQLVELAKGHSWLAFASILIGLVVRLLKDDTKGPVVPSRWRPLVAYGLGCVAAGLNALAGGVALNSVLLALVAPTIAIVGHVLGIETALGGEELPVPKFMRRGPPAGGAGRGALSALVLCLVLPGCSSFLHFSDPGVQSVVCGITSTLIPELQAIAALTGIPIWVVEDLYSDACSDAASKGLSQHEAEQAGLSMAKRRALRLHALRASFPKERPQ